MATETKAVRAAIGVTGQFAAVDELLSGRENLQLMADLKRVRSGDRVVTRLLERFDLVESADKLASTYSGGMRRKLDLAMTLVGNPQIIFLDEPTTGLDPRSRRTMWEIVRELVADGTTIFLTTQYLEEADQLADRIAVLDQGRLIAQGTPAGAQAPDPRHPRPAPVRRPARTRRGGAGPARVHAGRPGADPAGAQRRRDSKSLRALLDRLDEYTINAKEFSVHTPDLDDVFLALTGHANTGHSET